jgi:hypothetical protein
MVSIGMTGNEWNTVLGTATYATVNTEDWTVSYWVGADEAAWMTWSNAVQAKGTLANPFEATDTARFSAYVLSLKMAGPVTEGDGVFMVSTGMYARGGVALILAPGASSVETHRFITTVGTGYKLLKQNALVEVLKALPA